MKVRNGFVSNSSSSSFMIFGHMITDEEAKQLEANYSIDEDDEDDYFSLFDCMDKMLQESNIIYEQGLENYGDSTVFIGIDPDKLQEDKTLKQSKKELAIELKKVTGLDIKAEEIGFYCDGGYDN